MRKLIGSHLERNLCRREEAPGTTRAGRGRPRGRADDRRSVRDVPHVAGDGEQAMRFLRRAGEFTGAPRPGLILLDLNLPRRNGP